jgi:hypothetical protein
LLGRPDDPWDTLTRITGMVARTINTLSDAERQATRAAITENVAQFRDSDCPRSKFLPAPHG